MAAPSRRAIFGPSKATLWRGEPGKRPWCALGTRRLGLWGAGEDVATASCNLLHAMEDATRGMRVAAPVGVVAQCLCGHKVALRSPGLRLVHDESSPRLNLRRKKDTRNPPRCAGDSSHARSVSMLRVWLGQDRLSG